LLVKKKENKEQKTKKKKKKERESRTIKVEEARAPKRWMRQ
jgi:hypothetical protein